MEVIKSNDSVQEETDNSTITIMVVEDSAITQRIIDLHLRKHGFQTIICGHGQEAIEVLGQSSPISLILSDVMMPVMSGLDLLKNVKSNSEISHIPFLMLTGKKDKEIITAAIVNGCNDYIVKPIIPAVLISKVKSALGLEETVDPFTKRE